MDDTRRWFGGLPMVAMRTLTEEERAHAGVLRGELRGQLWKIAGFIALLLGIAVLQFYIHMYVLLIWAVIALVRRGPLRLHGYGRLAMAIRRDLRAGVVAVCEDGPVRIDVLPESRLLLRHNGILKYELVILSAGATAGLPEHARMAANFVRPVNDTTSVHQRILSDDELRELRGYVPPLPAGRIALALAAVAGTIASGVLAYTTAPDAWLLFAIFGVVAWFAGRPLLAAMRERSEVTRDAAERVVVIVKVTEPSGSYLVEVLPNSRILWTEETLPAAWRRMR